MGEGWSKDSKSPAHYPRRIKSGAFFREWSGRRRPDFGTQCPRQLAAPAV
jgi:hypothetical protein